MKKITLDDVKESHYEQIRELIHEEVRRLTEVKKFADVDRTVKELYETYLKKNASMVASMVASMRASMNASMRASMNASMRASMYASMRDSMDASMVASMNASMRASMYASMRASMHDSMDASMYASTSASMHDSMRDAFQNTKLINGFYCGQWWRYWSLWYRAGEVIGVNFDKTKTPKLFHDICRYAPIGIWFKDFCFVFPNCRTVSMKQVGETSAPWKFPIYELHNDGAPSWELYELKDYHWHNRKIPEKYGSVKSKDWESKWILEEENVELKRLLIEVIGYEKILQQLEAKKIDSWYGENLWENYDLYNIQNGDIEPIRLLTMTCPSSQHRHVLRVGPDAMTCREAITAVRGGVEPERIILHT